MNESKVTLGLDYSTHKLDIVGVCDGSFAFANEFVFRRREKFGHEHLISVFNLASYYVMKWIEVKEPVPLIYMEEPIIHMTHKSSVIPMARVAGAISVGVSYGQRDVLNTPSVLREVAASTWKKAVVGKGNASKSDVHDWVKDNTDDRVFERLQGSVNYGSGQDILDAYCIAIYGEGERRG